MDIHEAETAVKVIQRQNEFGEQVCQQLQDARAWAALWKRAAKWYRNRLRIEADRADGLYVDCVRQAAEIEQLRAALVRIVDEGPRGWSRFIAKRALEEDRP